MSDSIAEAVRCLARAAKVVGDAAGDRRAETHPAHKAAVAARDSAAAVLKPAEEAFKLSETAVADAKKLRARAASELAPAAMPQEITELVTRAETALQTATALRNDAQERADRIAVAINLMRDKDSTDVAAERLELLAAEIRDVLTRLIDESGEVVDLTSLAGQGHDHADEPGSGPA